jgi:hypothetical protein
MIYYCCAVEYSTNFVRLLVGHEVVGSLMVSSVSHRRAGAQSRGFDSLLAANKLLEIGKTDLISVLGNAALLEMMRRSTAS